jgi:hypothetical protein
MQPEQGIVTVICIVVEVTFELREEALVPGVMPWSLELHSIHIVCTQYAKYATTLVSPYYILIHTYSNTYGYVHTQIHTDTNILKHTDTYILHYTRIRAYSITRRYVHTPIHTDTYMLEYTRIRTCWNTHGYVHARIHTRIRTRSNTHTDTYTLEYTHGYVHDRIHTDTYIRTYTHTDSEGRLLCGADRASDGERLQGEGS